MKHHATSGFWKAYDALSDAMREAADRRFLLMKANPSHPSLHLKAVGRFWSARINQNYRALAVEEDGTFVWFWIGNHADYDRLIR